MILRDVDRRLNFEIGGQSLDIEIGLPFNWGVLFFSAVIFSLARLVYTIFAPELIASGIKIDEFLEGKRNIYQIIEFITPGSPLDRKIIDDLGKLNYIPNPRSKSYEDNNTFKWDNDSIEDITAIYWKSYNDSNNLLLGCRIIIGILYLIGFVLLGIVFWKSIETVITYYWL
jgi:hypothetical protein